MPLNLKRRIVPPMADKLQPKTRERAPFYKVTAAGSSDEINNRIGSMWDS